MPAAPVVSLVTKPLTRQRLMPVRSIVRDVSRSMDAALDCSPYQCRLDLTGEKARHPMDKGIASNDEYRAAQGIGDVGLFGIEILRRD
jgi:hypothetical protein